MQPVVLLGFTSNLVSSGLRETIRWLVEHKHVTTLVTTAGGVEEDIIKCLAPTFVGTFYPEAGDEILHLQHINRVGNLCIRNDNYIEFEDWLTPILQSMLDEQEQSVKLIDHLKDIVRREHEAGQAATAGYFSDMTEAQKELYNSKPVIWTPSKIIARLGKEINDPSSILYWAQKNDIEIFCPAITDGSFGDMLSAFMVRTNARAPFINVNNISSPTSSSFSIPTNIASTSQHTTRPAQKFSETLDDIEPPSPVMNPLHEQSPFPRPQQGLIVDIAADIHRLNSITRITGTEGAKIGAIVLGAGLVKHHVMNACLMGNGADAAIYINTANEYDGSDAGARPSEAVSWGKLKAGAPSVKVVGDATILFPMLVAATWAKVEEGQGEEDTEGET